MSEETLMVHSLVYVSAADATLTGVDMQALLEQSRRHNAAREITGLLLYRAGTFLQFLEGSEEAVEGLFTSIAADQRHHDVVLIRRRPQPFRQFPNWSMAYGEIDPTSTDPVAVEMPPPDGPAPQTVEEARFILELLEFFDPRPVAGEPDTTTLDVMLPGGVLSEGGSPVDGVARAASLPRRGD